MGFLDKLFTKKRNRSAEQIPQPAEKNDILMLSQLAAFYWKEQDEKFHQRYIQELMTGNVPQKDAQAMFAFDCDVIKKYGKQYLLHPDFTRLWFFGLRQPFFQNYPSTKDDILKEHFLTISELCKIIDEAEWHFWNSHERELPDGVWEEIFQWRLNGGGGEFAIKYFNMIRDETKMSDTSISAICASQGTHLSTYKWK